MRQPSRSSSGAVIAIVGIAALLALGGLFGTREETRQADSPDVLGTVADDLEAKLVGKRQEGGFSLLGITFSQPDHYVEVAFAVTAGCGEQLGDGDRWPVTSPECAGPADLAGPLRRSGRSAAGEVIVSVTVDVSADCYDAIEPGMSWPLLDAACAAPPQAP